MKNNRFVFLKKQIAIIQIVIFTISVSNIYGIEINLVYKGSNKYDKINIEHFDIIKEKKIILGVALPKIGEMNVFVVNLPKPVSNKYVQIFNNFIYLTEENSISIELNETIIIKCQSKYTGNISYQSFFKNIESPANNFNTLKFNILNYKESLKKYFLAKEDELTKLKNNSKISDEFYSFQSKENKYQYFSELLLINGDSTLTIPKEYLEEISNLELNSESSATRYYIFLMRYNSYLFKQKVFSFNHFLERSEKLKLHFKKNTYVFLLFHNFRIAKFNSEIDYLKSFDFIISKIDNLTIKDQLILSKATKLKARKVIPKENLSDCFENFNGEQFTLDEIISKQESKFIYFDFWASWCAPCLKAIPHSKILDNAISDDDVSFIYFSIDSNRQNWLKSIEKNNLKKENQFLLKNVDKSLILKYLEISSIPQYYIISRNIEMLFFKTAGPNEPELKYIFNNLLGLKK